MTLLASFFSAVSSLLLPERASAQAMAVICTGLAGCGQGAENTLVTHLLPLAVSLGIQIAAGGCVVLIMFAGVQMLISNGDEAKAQAGRKNILIALGGLGVAITSASAVSFVTTENFGQANQVDFLFGGGGLLDSVVRLTVFLFNVGFAIIALLAGFRMAMASGDAGEFKKGGTVLKWAVIGAVVVNLARAIVLAFLQIGL